MRDLTHKQYLDALARNGFEEYGFLQMVRRVSDGVHGIRIGMGFSGRTNRQKLAYVLQHFEEWDRKQALKQTITAS